MIKFTKTPMDIFVYRSRAIITSSWFEPTLNYKPRILGPTFLVYALNTSYLTDSYISFTLKMGCVVSKNSIFGLKMIVKSVLENSISNPSMREDSYFYYWIWDFGQFYKVIESSLPHGGISKIFFLDYWSPSFLEQKLYFWIQIPFWG